MSSKCQRDGHESSGSKKRRVGGPFRQHANLDDLLPGRSNPDASVLWPYDDWAALTQQGLKYFEIDFGAVGRERMYQGLCLSTDYSGLGAAEEALNQLLAASRSMAAAQGLPSDAAFQCQRAGDQATHCRKVLMCHTGPFRPCCIHNNIMDRCLEKFKTRMEAEREQGLKKAQQEVKLGVSNAKVAYGLHGQEVLQSIAQFMLYVGEREREAASLKAFCCIHRKQCPVIPPAPPGFQGWSIHCAGVCCYDWSAMGRREQWLGEGMPVFAQWARERKLAQEDIIW